MTTGRRDRLSSRVRTASTTWPGRSAALGASTRILWHGDDRRGRRRRRHPRGFRARRLPATRRDRALLAGHGARSTRLRRPRAVRSLGICNGFQVLTEAGPAPGRADAQRRACGSSAGPSSARSSRRESVLTARRDGRDGAPAADQPLRGQLHLRRRRRSPRSSAPARSCCATGTTRTARSHGDRRGREPAGNVVGLMPHPERASDPLGVGTDGVVLSSRCSRRRAPGSRRPAIRAGRAAI